MPEAVKQGVETTGKDVGALPGQQILLKIALKQLNRRPADRRQSALTATQCVLQRVTMLHVPLPNAICCMHGTRQRKDPHLTVVSLVTFTFALKAAHANPCMHVCSFKAAECQHPSNMLCCCEPQCSRCYTGMQQLTVARPHDDCYMHH